MLSAKDDNRTNLMIESYIQFAEEYERKGNYFDTDFLSKAFCEL